MTSAVTFAMADCTWLCLHGLAARGRRHEGQIGRLRQRPCGAHTWLQFKESKALMIEWFMFGALGFFLGCLLGLMLAPPLWNRAVKLTTRRLEATMPMTLAEIQADKDQIRADFAIQLRKVEVALEKSKERAARELIEANKRRVEIQKLNGSLEAAKGELHEAENANRVLQQTIKRRLPDLDARLKAAKKALSDLETVNAELRTTIASQSEALKIARATVHNQRADIDQLRISLESGSAAGRGSAKNDSRAVAESQRLAAELSRAKEDLERVRTSSEEIAFLRRELGHLSSQILEAARKQPPAWQSAAAAPAMAYPEATETEAEDEAAAAEETAMQEPVAYAGNGAAGTAAEFAGAAYEEPPQEGPYEAPYAEEAVAESVPAEETDAATSGQYTEEGYPDEEAQAAEAAYQAEDVQPVEPVQDEQAYAANLFNGEDDYEVEEDYETYEIQGHYAAQGHDDAEGDEEDEGEAAYEEAHAAGEADSENTAGEDEANSLSKRFAARRAKRQAEKSGGSLTSRLRGLVADSPERRG
jgi:hypothetical protein